MRFSTFAFGGLVALAQLAVATGEPSPAGDGSEASPTPAPAPLSPTAACIAACEVGDVNCQAKCVGVAHPNGAQADQTTQCAAKCSQGDGSPKAVQDYANCQQACISSYFPIGSAAGGALATGAAKTAGSGGATPTGTEGSGARETGFKANGTASGANSSSTGAANSNYAFSASMVGLGSVFMGLLAL